MLNYSRLWLRFLGYKRGGILQKRSKTGAFLGFPGLESVITLPKWLAVTVNLLAQLLANLEKR